MPVYQFESPKSKVIERLFPVEQTPDFVEYKGITYKRLKVPQSIVFVGGGHVTTSAEKTLNGYYQMEQRQGSRFQSKYTKKQIKDAWSKPVPE